MHGLIRSRIHATSFKYGTAFEEADEVNPGTELDALVVERVMGRNVPTRNTAPYTLLSDSGTSARLAADVRKWNPSECIADAWMVVEQLARCQYEVGVQISEGRYTALIARNGQTTAVASAETAPHAICLAAIQAYGYHVERGVISGSVTEQSPDHIDL